MITEVKKIPKILKAERYEDTVFFCERYRRCKEDDEDFFLLSSNQIRS